MSHWLYPANTKYYDVFEAFKQSDIYWPMNSKVEVDDLIYFYLALPYKQIAFVVKIVEVGILYDTIAKYVDGYVTSQPETADKKPVKLFMRLKLLKNIEIDKNSTLALSELKEHGLNGMLMGSRKLQNNPELLSYIQESHNDL